MGSFGKLFGTSKVLEQEGVEVDLGEGLKVRVARNNNKKYRDILQRKLRVHRAQHRNRNLPEDVVDRATIEATAAAILLGWSGAEDDGKPIEYSYENAVTMLSKYPDFLNQIAEISADMTVFQEEDEDAARKNSPPPSPGTSDIAETA